MAAPDSWLARLCCVGCFGGIELCQDARDVIEAERGVKLRVRIRCEENVWIRVLGAGVRGNAFAKLFKD